MNKIEVKILNHNCNICMPLFLAKLTQRGHEINNMADVLRLYTDCKDKKPSNKLMSLPHSTIRRMNTLTIAICGLSTKAVSQIRTHAKRLTFISTSTQYSSYADRSDNFVIPEGLNELQEKRVKKAYSDIEYIYSDLIKEGCDRDKISYLLPQGHRKTLIIHGNLDDWQYVLNIRLCNRNTREVQYIMELIYEEIKRVCGEEWTVGMLPNCVYGQCKEGKFSCGRRYHNETDK